MAKKILINALIATEKRVAIIEDGKLIDFDLESQEHFRTKSNIYKGIVTRVEQGLEAVFVNYGEERNGFLPIREIIPQYFSHGEKHRNLKDLIQVGQEVVVQVDKEARKDKGAALTTRISISGRFIVLMRGLKQKYLISRRLSYTERKQIEDWMPKFDLPEGFGAIIRTASSGQGFEDLEWDLKYLNRVWDLVQEEIVDHRAPQLLLKESDVISRTLRDYLNDDIEEIIIDTEAAHSHAETMLSKIFPTFKHKLKLHQQSIPLFTHYGIENQVQKAFQQVIQLPSGGQLVFDRTEAMFIIDVNSSKSVAGKDVEDTALMTNLEAVGEICRQMKIRDIGGLMVIDFIDMMKSPNRKKVEDAFHKELRGDNARVRFNNISRFGMMELSRQRLRSSLDEFYLEKCPTCQGKGAVATQSSTALRVLRLLEELAYNTAIQKVKLSVAPKIYSIIKEISNTRLEDLQKKFSEKVEIIQEEHFHHPGYKMVTIDNLGNETALGNYQSDTSPTYHQAHAKRKPLIEPEEILKALPKRRLSWQKRWGKFKRFIQNLFPQQNKKRRSSRKGRTRYARKNQSNYKNQSNHKSQSSYKNQSSYKSRSHSRNRHASRR